MEKRLSADQVPFVVGSGSLGGTFTKAEIVSTSPLSPIPLAPTIIPGTTLAFTLAFDMEVLLVATGTYENTGAGDTSADFGFKVDGGPDIFLGAAGVQTSGRNEIPFTIHKAVPLLAGPHTVDVIARENIGLTSLVRGTVTNPTTVTAIYVEPVGAIGALSKQEAINQTATSFTTTMTTPQIVPGTTVTVDIPIEQTVLFMGYATGSENTAAQDGVLGLQVTSPGPSTSDFAGTELIDSSATAGAHGAMVVTRAITLAAGIHTADITLRSGSGGTAEVINTLRGPTVLTAILTAPEQIPILTTTIAPEQIDAGDAAVIGTSGEASQADHQHAVSTGTPVDVDKSAAAEGSATSLARSDHKHDVSTAAPSTAGGTTNTEGSATSLTRSDHVHRVEVDVQDEASTVGNRPAINFTGGNVEATDDGGNDRVDVLIRAMTGFISGFIPANGADADHDIDFGAGIAVADDSSRVLSLSSTLTKEIDAAFAVGNNAGGLFSGSVAVDTWYHLFVIRRDSDGLIDAGFDTSVTAANIPGGFSRYRRIGSVLTDGSSNIIAFHADEIEGGGLHVLWLDPPLDADEDHDATAQLETLSVPPDYRVRACLNIQCEHLTADRQVYISSPDVNDEVPSTTAAPLGQINAASAILGDPDGRLGSAIVRTNTSSQIRWRSNGGGASRSIVTLGWSDPRRV